MNKTKLVVNKVSWVIVFFILIIISLSGLFLQSTYSYADFPYFEWITIEKILSVVIYIASFTVYIYIGKKVEWNQNVIVVVYCIVSLAYLLLVQLEPFSDMYEIYNIAINNFEDTNGYFARNNNQIPIIIYLWGITKIFGKSIWVPKCINVICNIIIAFTIKKIYLCFNPNKKEANAIVWISLALISPLLYENHIYNDVLFTTLTVVLVYLILKGNYSFSRIVAIIFLMAVQYLIRPCGIIYIIAIGMYLIMIQKQYKKCIFILLCTIILIVGITKINLHALEVDTNETLPVWSFIQMGINEEEFGFQDGTYSTEWTLNDCIEKYKKMGPLRVCKTLMKKELWMWTEGTYQAQRYGFGDSSAIYTCENSITQEIRNVENSNIRKWLDLITKSQYYIYMVLALVGVWMTRKDENYSLFLYIICGVACFYLIWEMKSRYIYSLYPLFIIYTFGGIKYIFEFVKKKIGDN